MGLWPFGRDPANVEMVSRIVTATLGDGVKVRGKITIHFADLQTQAIADDAAERCSVLMEVVLREQRSHEHVLGAEAEMVLKLVDRLPPNIVPTRAIELAALHVVGDPGPTARKRPSTAAFQAVRPASTPPAAQPARSTQRPPSSGSISVVAPGSVPPPSPVSGFAPPRRRSSNRMRALTASLVLPVGSSPQTIGVAIAPLARDTSARLLIGLLRIHDLVNVRGVVLDPGSPDLQVAIAAILEPPQSGEEQTRAAEVARWQAALGASVVDELRHEATTLAIYLAYMAITRVDVPHNIAIELLEECASRAVPGEPSPVVAMERYLRAPSGDIVPVIAGRIAQIVGAPGERSSMIAALSPLLSSVEEDISIAATLSKHSLGL